MQKFFFPKNFIVPFALQSKNKQPKGNALYNTMKNKHILKNISKCNREKCFLEINALK